MATAFDSGHDPGWWFNSAKGPYEFEQWLDGQVWQLEPGEDFTEAVHTFRAKLNARAAMRGLALRTRYLGNVLWVQAIPRDDVF